MNKDKTGTMVKMTFFTSQYSADVIKRVATQTNMPLSRIVAIGIDNEIERGDPFEYDLTLPEPGEHIDSTYADEGGKFLNYMKSLRIGTGLDMLMINRHDIGIPDKVALLTVFSDCLNVGIIEAFVPAPKRTRPPFPAGYFYYRMAGQQTARSKKMIEKDYAKYLRLKKKFEKSGEM